MCEFMHICGEKTHYNDRNLKKYKCFSLEVPCSSIVPCATLYSQDIIELCSNLIKSEVLEVGAWVQQRTATDG